MVRTAVLVSGGGTNLQAIIGSHLFGEIGNCDLTCVISSNPDAYALERAKTAGIPTTIIDYKKYPTRRTFNSALLQKLKDLDIELIVLAGFLHILERPIIKAYENRTINVHPSLIPSFCGDGCYGLHVHKMAIDYGVKISGATVHFVTEDVDSGPIILQKAVEVLDDDTPKTLQQRIMENAEWEILPKAINLYCTGKLDVQGRKVFIKEDNDSDDR